MKRTQSSRSGRNSRRGRSVFLGLAVFVLLAGLGLGRTVLPWSRAASSQPPQLDDSASLAAVVEPPAPATATPPPTSTVTSTPAPTDTPTPVPTHTPTPTPPPPSRLVIPAIKVDTPVLEMGWKTVEKKGQKSLEWDVPAFAAGWAISSARPGQGSNVVLSGHNNIEGEVFRYLSDLQIGDAMTLYADDAIYEYRIEDKQIIRDRGLPLAQRQANARWMDPTPDERLTLISCWPYNNNTHRIIIVARPANP